MEVVLHLPVVPNVELVAAKAVETLGGALGMDQTHVEAASVAMVLSLIHISEPTRPRRQSRMPSYA